MQNNLSPKIALQTGSNKKTRFNLSHDVTTTFDFGSTQPVMCQEMIPGSKSTLDLQALFRASPLVAPLFGRQKVEYRSFFIPIQSIMRHFQDSLLSQKAVAEGNDLRIFTEVPKIEPWRLLSCLLVGSRCSIYYGGVDATALSLSNSTSKSQANVFINALLNPAQSLLKVGNAMNDDFGLYHGESRINITRLLGLAAGPLWIPIASGVDGDATNGYTNKEKGFFFGSPNVTVNDSLNAFDFGAVPLETADFVFQKRFTLSSSTEVFNFAFSLSDAGKRLRKILLGLGYQTDFNYKEDFSLMPLFAYYMAYFDAFGLERFENFQTTNCAKCLTLFNNTNTQPALDANMTSWRGFIYDLMNTWATQPQDFIGSITDTVTISPNAAASYAELIEITGQPTDNLPISSVDTSAESSTTENGHSYINTVLHGQLDSELLKRLYRWVNRNTVIGKRVEEILRSQGLGTWIDSQKTHFIGKHEITLSVDEVSAMADTFQQVGNADSGSRLGSFAGKCVDFSKSKTISYDTNEFGYFITIAVLLPQGGYCQNLQSHVLETSKFDFYHPEFDALGHEAVTFGETVFCNPQVFRPDMPTSDGDNTDTFGFVPRYFTKKVKPNVQNGDINLPSTQNGYLPFTLDKLIFAQRAQVNKISKTAAGNNRYSWSVPMTQAKLPNASLSWRFYNKYPFLSNYNRIFFNNQSENYRSNWSTWESLEKTEVDYTMETRNDDNWICHQVNNLQYFAPMLPISESYGTFDDAENAPVMTMGKT